MLLAIADGRTIAALPREADGQVRAILVCRPSAGLAGLVPSLPDPLAAVSERALGADQSNTSAVLGERSCSRSTGGSRTGLNPELELLAFLTEEAAFRGRAAAGRLRRDGLGRRRGRPPSPSARRSSPTAPTRTSRSPRSLTAWLLAPGEVSVEFATEVAADLGALTAGLHAALANAQGIPDFEPRTGDPGRAARLGPCRPDPAVARDRRRRPARPVGCLRDLAPRIAAELSVFEALATPAAPDPGPRRLPPRPGAHRARRLPHRRLRGRAAATARGASGASSPAARRGLDAALARPRRAQRRAARPRRATVAPATPPGLDLDGWLRRSRERFLDAYKAGLREAGAPIDRSTRTCSARSRSRRSATSSSTRRRTCRRGCGRRPRACAACSRDGQAADGERVHGGPDLAEAFDRLEVERDGGRRRSARRCRVAGRPSRPSATSARRARRRSGRATRRRSQVRFSIRVASGDLVPAGLRRLRARRGRGHRR